uniref:Uncharacterized protein n=1 Tax=Vitis vinifera TaxID=29760 RepID=F6H9M7_VITVI
MIFLLLFLGQYFFLTIRMGFWDFCLVAGRVAAKRSKLKVSICSERSIFLLTI